MSGFAIRDEMNAIQEAPGKTWFFELEEAVIAAGRCIQCGACVAVCPSDSIGVAADDGLPELVKMCTGCSLCWDFCPRAGMRHEATWALTDDSWKMTGSDLPGRLDALRARYTARVRPGLPRVQDGGVVSALLMALLDRGEVDGVLLARESETERWKGVPHVVTTAEEVAACGGSFYNQTMGLAALDLSGCALPDNPRLAVVGTPCETEAIRAMQTYPWSWGSHQVGAVVLTIALLCTKSFDYEALMLREVRDKRGVDLDRVGRVDVIRGKLIVQGRRGETLVEEPIKDFHGAALKGCDECADFLGNAADISVGSVGSADGYSSVLVRTEAGVMAFEHARPMLELRGLDDPVALEKLDGLDKRVARRSLKRDFDPDGELFIDLAEHVRSYASTDRAPVKRDR